TPPPFGYRIAARISVQPHILMPFSLKSEVERLLAIPTPPISPVSLTSYTLPPLLTPFPVYTPLPTSSFPLPSPIPSTSVMRGPYEYISNSDGGFTEGGQYPAETTTSEKAYAMTWATLKKKMTGKYWPRGEFKKIKTEMWNLKVKGNDVVAYNRRFQQLALMCSRMFPKEVDKIEKYISGLPDMILGSVKASRSKTMQEVIEFTTELMEDKTRAYAERQADNKRKSEDIARNNQNQQPYKRQNTYQVYTVGNGDKRLYAGSRPLCPKCN
nr:hypothetical protein [Tanacetum cinerariifolium]